MIGSRILLACLSLLIAVPASVHGAPAGPGNGFLIPPDQLLREGDGYYERQQYRTAMLYHLQGFKERPDPDSASRLLLDHLRLGLDGEADSHWIGRALSLEQEGPFSYHYISLFASYRLNRPDLAELHEQNLEAKARTSLSLVERNWFLLLQGSRFIEEQRWTEAAERFNELAKAPGEAGLVAAKVSQALRDREMLPRKSPWTAATLSAVLPGAGQFYSRHYSDGVMAFFWNATFLGGGAYIYNLENAAGRPHSGSILAILVGLLFYSSNIAGAYASANQFNIYQDRKFYQNVRDASFNVDFVERTSGLEFTRPLQFE